MRRILVGLLFSALILLGTNLSARGCYNDREVERAEREFRSQYSSPPPAQAAPSPSLEEQVKVYGPLTMGGLLLVGAVVQTARRSRK
jgi:hypothetical protein